MVIHKTIPHQEISTLEMKKKFCVFITQIRLHRRKFSGNLCLYSGQIGETERIRFLSVFLAKQTIFKNKMIIL